MDIIAVRWCVKPKPKNTINRALLLHNHSFRSLESYKPLRSKGGLRSSQGKETLPHHGETKLPSQGIE
ncbi:hypothetical protein L195_g034731, partial [Trifolium pratense]